MDGRVALKLGVCLLIAAAGCQHQEWTMSGSSPKPSGNNAPPPPAPGQVKKASTKPKDLPPMVLVKLADWKSLEAFDGRAAPEGRQAICEMARADYEKALKTDPKCVPAYQGLARLYTRMHDLPLAMETYQKALKLSPNNASLWYEMGMCHNYQKNWGPALDCLDRAVKLDPGNRAYVSTQAVVLAAAGRYDDSLNCFVRTNGEAMGYYRMGQTLQHLQQTELSWRYLEAAVQKDPNLATLAMQSKDNEAVAPQAPPVVQQTAYLAPPVPTPQAAPMPLPQVVSPGGAAGENPAPPQRMVLPPAPAINMDYR